MVTEKQLKELDDYSKKSLLRCIAADIVFHELETQSQILGLLENMIEDIENESNG